VKLQDAQPVVAHDVKDMGASGHIQGICSKCSSANRQILLFSDLQDSYLVNTTIKRKKGRGKERIVLCVASKYLA